MRSEREAPPISLAVGNVGSFELSEIAHGQIAQWAGIPKKYYDRLRTSARRLLEDNVNVWLHRSDDRRMVRTLDGRGRAFLSDRYRPLDNTLVMEAALPSMLQEQGMTVKSCQLTDRRLYIQAVTKRLEGEVRQGDVVQAGLVLSNSEVGCGTVRVEPLIFRLACLNGMITRTAIKKYHVGKRVGGNGPDDVAWEFYRDETRQADDRAFLLKIRDTVGNALDEQAFQEEVNRLRRATQDALPAGKTAAVVEEVTRRLDLTQQEGESVLESLIQDGDLSRYGLANAITAQANEAESYDRAVDLERVGHEVIELAPQNWETVVSAA